MGSKFIKCSFDKDADPARPDPRGKLFTYIDDSADGLKVGDIAQVVDPKGTKKRVKVMEVGTPQPPFPCKPAVRYVEPSHDAPPNSTPNMAADNYAAAKAASAAAAKRVARPDPFLDDVREPRLEDNGDDDGLDF